MKCLFCKQGDTAEGRATGTLERGGTTIVIKQVPAEVCQNCGEYYLSETMSENVIQMAEDAVRRGAEIEVVRFVA